MQPKLRQFVHWVNQMRPELYLKNNQQMNVRVFVCVCACAYCHMPNIKFDFHSTSFLHHFKLNLFRKVVAKVNTMSFLLNLLVSLVFSKKKDSPSKDGLCCWKKEYYRLESYNSLIPSARQDFVGLKFFSSFSRMFVLKIMCTSSLSFL